MFVSLSPPLTKYSPFPNSFPLFLLCSSSPLLTRYFPAFPSLFLFSSVYQIFTFAKFLPTLLNIFSAHEIYFFAKNSKIQSSGKIIQNLHSLLILVLSDLLCPLHHNLVDAKGTSTYKVQSSKIFSWGLLVVMKPLTTNGPGRCLKTKNMMDSRTCHHDYLIMFCNRSGRPLHRRRLVLRRVSHLWRVGDDCSSLCWWCQLLWHHGWEKDIRMDGKS